MRQVLYLDEINAGDSRIAGGKGANLGELVAAGFPVPPGFVVSTDAYREFVGVSGLARDLEALNGTSREDLGPRCTALQRRIVEAQIPANLAEAIAAAHNRVLANRAHNILFAVRSSATAEDLAGASFAGQHGTYYYVGAGRLLEVIRRCWASLWSPEAAAYRATRGIPHASVFMAVVVQEMIESEVSGVTFTANPVSGSSDEIVIEASWGMGAALVDGRVTPDRYVVTRDGLHVRERRIAEKRVMVASRVSRERDARLERVSLSMQHKETLGDAQVRAVAELALRCERHFDTPQDVEWAIADGRIHLLQSRPITALGRAAAAPVVKGKWVLFKAMAENFTDPLTPLTQDLVSNPPFPGLRFIGGRIYMNLDAVRPLVPLVLSDEDLASVLYLSETASGKPLRISWVRVPVALLALLVNHMVLGVLFARTRGMPNDFMDGYRVLCRDVVSDPSIDPVGAVRRLLLLPRLFAPLSHMVLLVNVASMRFMPWMAVLKWMLRRWVPGVGSDAVALLCSGSEGVLSAEMGREIARLARRARRSVAMQDLLLSAEPEDALARLSREPAAQELREQLAAFLAVHGHRAIKEFELAAPRWEENPAPVLGMVRNHLLADQDPVDHGAYTRAARTQLEADIKQALDELPLERTLGWRRRLIRLAASRARYYLRLRENSRFYHIMGFGAVRKKILAVEDELLRAGKLRCRDDVFFLSWDEVAALRQGRLRWRDVEDRIRFRRLEHVRLCKSRPPKTIGIEVRSTAGNGGDLLRGHGASPGRYAGTARVILDPAVDAVLHPGEVLVAPYTDPAWTPLFLTAGAAIVEVGSYLSHAGTVAREYGMPCVVDVPDCTQRIATGMRVQVDGDRGSVRILDAAGGGTSG
jgi:pyruvate,water dikinase